MPDTSTALGAGNFCFHEGVKVPRFATKRLVWDNEDIPVARNCATLTRWNAQLFTTGERASGGRKGVEREATCSDKKINSVYRCFIGIRSESVKDSSRNYSL